MHGKRVNISEAIQRLRELRDCISLNLDSEFAIGSLVVASGSGQVEQPYVAHI